MPSRNADHIPGTGFHPLTVALDDQPPIENIVDLIVLVAVTELAAVKFPLTQGRLRPAFRRGGNEEKACRLFG